MPCVHVCIKLIHTACCRWLPVQFDAMVHIDRTSAVQPLDTFFEELPEHRGELPETFPFGL